MRKLAGSILCIVLLMLWGCGKGDVEKARERMAKEGGAGAPGTAPQQPGTNPHTGMGARGGMGMRMGGDAAAPTDGNPIPLKQTGVGSAAELAREKAKLRDDKAALDFEHAFRLTFTTDRALRDPSQARDLLAPILTVHPDFAAGYRTLGYAEFSTNPGDAQAALRHYDKAVQLDPKYGEAYYAIAFMHAATGDRQAGVQAYRKAMQLGVPDERNIGESFYSDLLKNP